jgi:hypothetical protein
MKTRIPFIDIDLFIIAVIVGTKKIKNIKNNPNVCIAIVTSKIVTKWTRSSSSILYS